MKFTTKNIPQIKLDINCCYKLTSKSYVTSFLGIHVLDSTLDFKISTEEITPSLSAVFHAERSVKLITLHEH
jgi:hypothetical protein